MKKPRGKNDTTTLVKAVARRLGLRWQDCLPIVAEFLKQACLALVVNGRVNMSGFGAFTVILRKKVLLQGKQYSGEYKPVLTDTHFITFAKSPEFTAMFPHERKELTDEQLEEHRRRRANGEVRSSTKGQPGGAREESESGVPILRGKAVSTRNRIEVPAPRQRAVRVTSKK